MVSRLRPGGSRFTTVKVKVPVPDTLAVRTVNYAYPKPQQRNSKTIRIPLRLRKIGKMVLRTIGVRIPKILPYVPGSYVSIDRRRLRPKTYAVEPGYMMDRRKVKPLVRLNIHPKKRFRRLMETENNRRRYVEHKSNRRKARNGQLESMRSDRYGMVAEAYRRGMSMREIADAAMVQRGLIE